MAKKHRLLKLITFLGAGLHLSNRMIDLKSAPTRSKGPEARSYQWKNGSIFYQQIGPEDAQPILLIHNIGPSYASFVWSGVAEGLQDTYQVYSMDLLGCGFSDKPDTSYTNYLYVQQVLNFIEDVIKQPVHIVADGMSSSIVLSAHQFRPELFQSITMINPVQEYQPVLPVKLSADFLDTLKNIPVLGTSIYYYFSNRRQVELFAEEKLLFDPFHVKHSLYQDLYQMAHTSHADGKYLFFSLEAGYFTGVQELKGDLVLPILILTGQGTKWADAGAPLYPNYDYQVIPEAKYLPQVENTKAVLEAIRSFLA